MHAKAVEETVGIIAQNSVSLTEKERLASSAEQTLLQMGKVARMDLLAQSANERTARIQALRGCLGEAMNDEAVVSSPLMRLPEAQRKTYEHFFELVYECSVNRVAAKALIDRILVRLG